MAHKILLTQESDDFLNYLKLSNKTFKKSTFIKAIIIVFAKTDKKKNIFLLPKFYNSNLSILNRVLIENFILENKKDIDELFFLKNKKWIREISINFNKNELKYLNSLFEYQQFKVFKKNNICLSCFINSVINIFYKFNLFLKTNEYNIGWNYLLQFDKFKQDILSDIKNGTKDYYSKIFNRLTGTKDLKIWVLLIQFFLIDVIANLNTKNVVDAKKFILSFEINFSKLNFDINVIKETKI